MAIYLRSEPRAPLSMLRATTILPLVAAMLMLLGLAGCSGRESGASAPSADSAGVAVAGEAAAPEKLMAYEHSIQMTVPEKQVAEVYHSVEKACEQARAELCVVMGGNVSTGGLASAEISLRAKSAGVQKIIGLLSDKGHVVSHSVTSEDLAGSIGDGAKRLAMLSDYRSKLEALRGRAGSDIDELMKLNKELVQVQSDIEALAGEQAHFYRRVETEILRVSIESAEGLSPWRSVERAWSESLENFSEGVSDIIVSVTYFTPWVLVLIFLTWLGRKLWRRMKK